LNLKFRSPGIATLEAIDECLSNVITKSPKRKVVEMLDKHVLGEQSARYNNVSGARNNGLRLDDEHFPSYLSVESIR
jgi:hypothetical protein